MASRTFLFVVGSLLAIACRTSSPAHDRTADEKAVRALVAEAVRAENTEDLAAWLQTIADDAVIVTPAGTVRGKAAIGKVMGSLFESTDLQGGWTIEGLELSGDLAVIWGPADLTLIAKTGRAKSRTVGYHLDALRREADGSWKFTWWTAQTRTIPDSSR